MDGPSLYGCSLSIGALIGVRDIVSKPSQANSCKFHSDHFITHMCTRYIPTNNSAGWMCGWAGSVGWHGCKKCCCSQPFLLHVMDPRQHTGPEEDYYDDRNKKKKLKKTYEEFAGGRTDNWMNVDESIMVS